MEWERRTELLVGSEGIDVLKRAHVLVVGLGGVGAYTAETLCRAGIGKMTIVDGDVVDSTNRNRQLPALISNEGKEKAKVLAERFMDINPNLELEVICDYIREDKIPELVLRYKYDYVIDAIDTLSPKVCLVYHCVQNGLNIVSSMGAGGKLDPSKIRISDISQSYNCRLARFMRKRLGKMGVREGVKVVFSPEEIDKSKVVLEESQNKKSTIGTISYIPPAFGCFISSVVIRDLLKNYEFSVPTPL
jgi:tRNA A37 threonylcarbamoyladenosine dehydratase